MERDAEGPARIARWLGAALLLLAIAGWGLVIERKYDLLPRTEGIEGFNAELGTDLGERPVLRRRGGFRDAYSLFRLEASLEELERVAEQAGLERVEDTRRSPPPGQPYWWQPPIAGTGMHYGAKNAEQRYWIDLHYDPESGLLYASYATY